MEPKTLVVEDSIENGKLLAAVWHFVLLVLERLKDMKKTGIQTLLFPDSCEAKMVRNAGRTGGSQPCGGYRERLPTSRCFLSDLCMAVKVYVWILKSHRPRRPLMGGSSNETTSINHGGLL